MSDGFLLLADAFTIPWQERLSIVFADHWQQLLCCVLIGAVLGVLGCFVILRRMALIGDAISHAVLPGVVIAFILVSTGMLGLFIGALLAALVTAVGINLMTRHSRVKEDAAIGIMFTAMFAVGIILISSMPTGTHFDMKCFLFGDPLAVRREDLMAILVITPIVLGVVALLFRPLKLMSFDPTMAATLGFNVNALHYLLMVLLAGTVVAALSSVGVIMAVAMLITPAAVGYQLTNRLHWMLILAGAAGAISAFVGMFLAFLINAPPGPAMVLVATFLFLLTMALAPERGLLAAWLRRKRIQDHIVEEDVLKSLYMRGESASSGSRPAIILPSITSAQLERALRQLEQEHFVASRDGHPVLTESGNARAIELVRAHRLWETYLAEQNISLENVHDEAERLEHAHRLAEVLAVELGNPQVDPHGSPIPRKPG